MAGVKPSGGDLLCGAVVATRRLTGALQSVKLTVVSVTRHEGDEMNVIDSDLTEALSALAAKCPGASLHVSAHHVPCETFAADDVRKVHVVNGGGRTWLAGTAEYHADGFEYRIEFYSVDLPQASSPDLAADADAEVIPL